MFSQHNYNSLVFNLKDNPNTLSGKSFDFSAPWKKTALSTEEATNAINKYNVASVKRRFNQEDYLKSVSDPRMKTYLSSVEKGTASVDGYTAAVQRTTLASRAAAFGMKAMSVAMNIGVMLAVSIAISAVLGGINSLVKAQENARKSAIEAATALEQETQSIDDYKSRISDLKEALDSGNLSQTEAAQKRIELLRIQDDLIDKYGGEKDAVDNVTLAINGQVDALDNLKRAKSEEYLRENQKAVNSAKTYKEKDSTYRVAGNWISTFGEQVTDAGFDGRRGTIKKTVDEALDAYETLYDSIDKTVGKNKELKKIALEYISDKIKGIKESEKYTENSEVYKNANAAIAATDYSDYYSSILEAQNNFNEAMASGDQTRITEATESLKTARDNALNEVKNSDNSKGLTDFFVNMLSAQENAIKQFDFGKAIEENDSLKNASDILSKFIAGTSESDFTKDQADAFELLTEKASEFGIEATEVEDILVALGVILPDLTNNINDSGDAMTSFADSMDSLQSQYDTLQTAVNEFNESGAINADTLKTLTKNDLLQYLEVVNGKLVVNSEALQNAAQDAKEKAVSDIQASLASNVLAIIQEDLETKTDNAGGALQNAKTDADDFANSASSAATGALILAGGMAAVKSAYDGVLDGNALSEEAEAKIQDAVNNANKLIGLANRVSISGGGRGRSGGGSRSKSQKDPIKEAFDAEYKALKYSLDMDLITQRDYYDSLTGLDKKYYEGKKKYEEEHRKNLQELYGLEKALFNDYVNDIEHEIFLTSKQEGTEERQIALHRHLQDKLHQEAEKARARDLDKNDEYLQSLQKQWHEHADEVISIQNDILEAQKKAIEDQIDDYNKEMKGMQKAALEALDQEIGDLNKRLIRRNQYYDRKIERLQEEKEALNQVADEQKRLFDIEQAREALAKAKQSKTKQIFKEGFGLVWENDFEVVTDAQNNLDNLLGEWDKYQRELALDEQIKDFEDAKKRNEENIKEQILDLEALKDAWSKSLDIEDDVTKYEGNLDNIIGFESDNFKDRLKLVKEFVNDYNDELARIKSQIKDTDNNSNSGRTLQVNSDGRAPSNAKVGDTIHTAGGDFKITGKKSDGGWTSKKVRNKYANGTLFSDDEFANVNELGDELFIEKPQSGIYKKLEYGTSVVPHEPAKNLMNFGFNPEGFVGNMLNKIHLPNINPTSKDTILQFTGDINLPHVTDANSFGKEMLQFSATKMKQQLG